MNKILPSVIRATVASIVDHFMDNRPLNFMLQTLVDRDGNISAVRSGGSTRRYSMVLEGDCPKTATRIHLRMHRGDVISIGTVLGELINGKHWDTAFEAPFSTPVFNIVLDVRQDKQSGWITIHFQELNDLLERVRQLARA